MISQSTNDSPSRSGSLDNSDSNSIFQPQRCFEEYPQSSAQQQEDYQQPTQAQSIPQDKLSQNQSPSASFYKKNFLVCILSIFLLAFVVAGFYGYNLKEGHQLENTMNNKNQVKEAINQNEILLMNLERLFNPIHLKYIKSYEESAVGKYFYWDILAEEYFNLIRDQLRRIFWLEEDVIQLFFEEKLKARDSQIIRKKVWKLREKSSDVDVSVNFNGKRIWIYKSCICS